MLFDFLFFFVSILYPLKLEFESINGWGWVRWRTADINLMNFRRPPERGKIGGNINHPWHQVIIDILDYPIHPLLALTCIQNSYALRVIFVRAAPIFKGEDRVELDLLKFPGLWPVVAPEGRLIFDRFRIPQWLSTDHHLETRVRDVSQVNLRDFRLYRGFFDLRGLPACR